ncbi:hypothetical protein [Neomoorella mulderi]|uniref:hypothetical protein n=1 Tax=Neomoorella mulderi TaxID=202604 RepID=UPI0012904A49|nr:hypothetical protein [Moorella mulderi]
MFRLFCINILYLIIPIQDLYLLFNKLTAVEVSKTRHLAGGRVALDQEAITSAILPEPVDLAAVGQGLPGGLRVAAASRAGGRMSGSREKH